MAELFEGTQLPKWMMPSTFLLESEQAAEGIGRTFASSFASAANRSEEKRQFDARTKAAASKIAKLTGIAAQLEGVTSAEEALDLASKNPQWLADPDTAPLVKNFIGLQGKIASVELNSIQGKTKLADMSAFVKGMAEIDPEDRAMIQSMSRNQDGSYSGDQWKALSMAKERVNLRRKNEAEAAALEAQARGDVQTTTITDKGITTRFSPKPDEKSPESGEIRYETPFPEMPWIKTATTPKGTLHVIRGESPMTATQKGRVLGAIASAQKNLKESRNDEEKSTLQKQIEVLNSALQPEAQKPTEPAPETKPDSHQFKQGQKAIQDGRTYIFDGKNWNPE